MKRSNLLKVIVCLLLIFSAAGVNSANARIWDVQQIRERYSAVKAEIAAGNVEGAVKNSSTLTMEHMVPGTGPQTVRYEFFFSPYDYNEDGYLVDHRLELVQTSYNIAARKMYEEYLYDGDGNLLFIYGRRPDEENGGWIETRLYFSGYRIINAQVSGKSLANPSYYYDELLWKAGRASAIAADMFGSVNYEYKESEQYKNEYGDASREQIVKNISEDIMSIPGASQYSLILESEPSSDEPYYTFRLGENGTDNFNTILWFHAYPFGRYYNLKVYDIVTDSDVALDEWLKINGSVR